MLSLRRAFAVVSLFVAGSVMVAEPAHAQRVCRGFGPGYGVAVARSCWYPGGWYGGWRTACIPRPWACRPWGWGAACTSWGVPVWPRVCGPRPWCGPWYGWPGCGFGGWYGGGSFFGYESVSLAVPPGGGATFFSGSAVPFPVPYGVPYGVPYPVAVPWFGAAVRPAAVAPIVAAHRSEQRLRRSDSPARIVPPPPRPVMVLARRRARTLVAQGDDLLRRAAGDPVRLEAAASAYRRAAAVAADDPDVHIRHAIVLAALGRRAESGQAARQAAAIDGRLADRPGERNGDEATPLVARGRAILRTIAAVEDGPLPGPFAELATAWAGGGPRPLGAVASADARVSP